MRIVFLLFICFITLSACTTETVYAPVTELSNIEKVPSSGRYRVLPNDTLYSIAWRYGLDYRTLVKINHITKPYHILTGQIIYLRANKKRIIKSKPPRTPGKKIAREWVENEPSYQVAIWQWPAKGQIISRYSNLNKGINIGGYSGQPIVASAAGKVVYAGDGLRSYGNLIIIKHNNDWFSAYAHNKQNGVKEGQWVKQGEKIAEMGDSGTSRNMLHFEIRRNGKPVNPIIYLRKKWK